MNSFFRKLRWLTRRSDKEAELREELHNQRSLRKKEFIAPPDRLDSESMPSVWRSRGRERVRQAGCGG